MSGEECPLDLELMEEISGGDREFVAELYHTFLNDAETKLPQLTSVVEVFNGREVREVAHAFLGSARCFGAAKLEEAAQRLEEIGIQGRQDLVMEAYQSFHTELQSVTGYMRSELTKAPQIEQ